MDLTRRALLLGVGLLAACILQGCAAGGQQKPAQQAAPEPAPFVRADHLCASLGQGEANAGAIKKDLVAILAKVDGPLYVANSEGDTYEVSGITGVSESGFQARHVKFDYGELMDRRVSHYANNDWGYNIVIQGFMSFRFFNKDLAKCVAEEILAIQKDLRREYVEGNLASFQTYLGEYRAMKTKPPVTEEQRRFIVQANAMTEKKDYPAAIELYHKALKLDRVSYPAAYYNMALIFSQMGRHQAAILFMKVYLLLVPEAEDARAAQDKIYEWEAFSGVQ
jgi:tetratricopeptide (TPR) repeat protein